MKVTYAGNTLKVTSPISKEAFEKGFVKTNLTDEKGNQVYAIGFSKSGVGSISKRGIIFNSVNTDGTLALVEVLPASATKEQVSLDYGDSIIEAQKNLPLIAAAAVEREAVLSQLFGNEEADAE